MLNRLWSIVSHLALVLGVLFLVLIVLDLYNPMMEYLTGLPGRLFLAVLCVCAIVDGVLTARYFYWSNHWRGPNF